MLCQFPLGKSRYAVMVLTCLALIISIGCGSPGSSGFSPQQAAATPAADDSQSTAQNAEKPGSTIKILLYNGTGTGASDVSAVEALLSSNNLLYDTANTSQLEAKSESELEAYKLFIVPGGNSVTIGENLSSTATNNIHDAVINGGLHYMGVCAGAFFGGYSDHNGLNLTNGVWFNTYDNGGHGTGKTAVETSYANGPDLDQYWQDGPELDGWGEIVSKYPDGTSAIVQGASGKGWVLLSGIHAEAPASWRDGMNFNTPVSVDNAYFYTMVTAALNGSSLPHY